MQHERLRRFVVFTSVVAAGALPGAATAASTAQATLSNLQVQLFDLTPDDGIAPSVSWARQSNIVDLNLSNLSTSQTFGELRAAPGVFPAVLSVQGSLTDVSGISQMRSDGWTVSATAEQPGTFFNGRALTARDGPTSGSLGANSRLVISFDAQVEISGLDHCAASGINPCSFAQATLSASAIPWSGLRPGLQLSLQRTGTSTGNGVPYQLTDSGTFYWELVNATTSPVDITLQIEASISGRETLAAPIPEPATWALWFAGIGGLGAIARGRRSR